MSRLQVLLHAPTPQALERARSNAKNLAAADPDAAIEIVVNAAGARAATESADDATDAHLLVCENSLRKQGLTARAGLKTVGAAVLHLAQRQAEGWAYIRC
ncbi:MAG: hypothetical protein KI785_01995 [Devosiaceae bacterium]|nr:hypothetical protein [Devosiaceae bacterium MH13]